MSTRLLRPLALAVLLGGYTLVSIGWSQTAGTSGSSSTSGTSGTSSQGTDTSSATQSQPQTGSQTNQTGQTQIDQGQTGTDLQTQQQLRSQQGAAVDLSSQQRDRLSRQQTTQDQYQSQQDANMDRDPGFDRGSVRTFRDDRQDVRRYRQELRDDRQQLRDDRRPFRDDRFSQPTEIRTLDDLGLQVNESNDGLTIARIERDSILSNSGLLPGDVIVSTRQRPIRDRMQFLRWFRSLDGWNSVPVEVLRDGRRETIYITGVDRDRWSGRDETWSQTDRGAYLGVVFDDRYPNLALVEVVRPNTAAERIGLRPGDVIQRINGQRVRSQRHASQLIGQMEPGESVDVAFTRRTLARASATLGARSEAQQAYYDDYDSGDSEDYYESRQARRRTYEGGWQDGDDQYDQQGRGRQQFNQQQYRDQQQYRGDQQQQGQQQGDQQQPND